MIFESPQSFVPVLIETCARFSLSWKLQGHCKHTKLHNLKILSPLSIFIDTAFCSYFCYLITQKCLGIFYNPRFTVPISWVHCDFYFRVVLENWIEYICTDQYSSGKVTIKISDWWYDVENGWEHCKAGIIKEVTEGLHISISPTSIREEGGLPNPLEDWN